MFLKMAKDKWTTCATCDHRHILWYSRHWRYWVSPDD